MDIIIRYLKRHKCGLRSIQAWHPLKFVASIGAAFKARPEETTGLALRGSVAILFEDREGDVKPNSANGKANLVDSIARRQHRVVRSTSNAELNGLVDSIQQMLLLLLLQCALHQIYCGTAQRPEYMIGPLERGMLYPPLDICVDARAVYDAISATDACEPAESNLKLHLISVRDMMTRNMIRRLYWVDARDTLADGLTKGGVDRTLLTRVCNECRFQATHDALVHTKHKESGCAIIASKEEDAPECHGHQ